MNAESLGFWAFFIGIFAVGFGIFYLARFVRSLFANCPDCGKRRPKFVKSTFYGSSTSVGSSNVGGKWKRQKTTRGRRVWTWKCRGCGKEFTTSGKASYTQDV